MERRNFWRRSFSLLGYQPLYATIFFLFLSVLLWQLLLHQEVRDQQKITQVTLQSTKDEITERLNQYAAALQRFATRVEYLGTEDKKYLELDSQSYLRHLKGLNRIGITNPDLKVIWSYPPEINQHVVNFDEGEDEDDKKRAAFSHALAQRQLTLSEEVELKSGGSGFILPVPLFKKGHHFGFLYSTIGLGTCQSRY